MLPLEAMGPGGSLSSVLVAMPYWQDASWRESLQAAMATAAYSCDQMAAAPVLQLWSGWRRQWWSSIGFQRQWIPNYVIAFSYSAFLYQKLKNLVLVDPVTNSAFKLIS
jgi:hypothetical protein